MPITPNKSLVARRVGLTRATTIVPYLTPDEVRQLEDAALEAPRKGDRNALLVRVMFQTGLRISEALSLTPAHVEVFDGRPAFRIVGKGSKPRRVACPITLAESLQAYAFRHGLQRTDRFFPINRFRGYQIITKAAKRAGLEKRVYPHLLRHSDAIERLRQTRNPKALQDHLGHASPLMTLRYLSTLQEEDSLRIQQDVEFDY
jgi:integrase/recombinase XerD